MSLLYDRLISFDAACLATHSAQKKLRKDGTVVRFATCELTIRTSPRVGALRSTSCKGRWTRLIAANIPAVASACLTELNSMSRIAERHECVGLELIRMLRGCSCSRADRAAVIGRAIATVS